MNWIDLPVLSQILSKTGLKPYIPTGPAGGAKLRARLLCGATRPAVVYTGPPAIDIPVIPLQVWGVQYDLDLVIVSDHPRYNMHEYARVQTPNGPVWLAKDALEDGLTQSLIADLDPIESWLPELPIVRKQHPLQVTDRSTESQLDLQFSYSNLEGEPVEVSYRGPPPRTYQLWRNGSTMGHSAGTILAALDIPYKNFAKHASIRIAGVERNIERLLGLVKLQVVLQQTQGGLATSEIQINPSKTTAFTAKYRDQHGGWQTTDWVERDHPKYRRYVQVQDLRTLIYDFVDTDGTLELAAMSTEQFGLDCPVSSISISPPLPDLRRAFEGVIHSHYVLDINDQQTQAYGRIEAQWQGDVAVLKMVPEAPEWTTDRPMETRISYADGGARVHIVRVETTPAPPND